MQNKGLGNWIHRRRVKSAGRPAVTGMGLSYTYDQLAGRIDRLATALEERGVAPGDRVAYLGNNHPAFLEVLFASGLLGAIFVPLNTRLAPPEVQFALQDSGSTVLVVDAFLAELAQRGAVETSVEHTLVVPREGATVEADFEDYDAAVSAAAPAVRDIPVSLEDAAIILYTSGTTGRPKGAVLTHGNMTWNSINVLVDYDVTSDAVGLMIAPLFHVASLGMGALPLLLKGAHAVLQDRFEPGVVLSAIEEFGVTSLSGVPTTYQMLAEHPQWADADLSSLRMLTCGGSAVPVRVMDAYEERGLSFSGGYGMTETAPGATSVPPHYSREKMGSAGLSHFFTDVRVVDAMGNELPAGSVGEIIIQGPNVIHEYWNRPDTAAGMFQDGDWFKSGDMGYLDDQGFLFISDRIKDMIISGGENIYPAEVEQIIIELDQVSAVAVIGLPDEKWGEIPHAVIAVAEGKSLTQEEVLAHLDGRLARYKIPKSASFVDEMPRTASGKIRKAVLRDQYANARTSKK